MTNNSKNSVKAQTKLKAQTKSTTNYKLVYSRNDNKIK